MDISLSIWGTFPKKEKDMKDSVIYERGISFPIFQETPPPMIRIKCEWKFIGPHYFSKWETECGMNIPDRMIAIPTAKDFIFCPYCGKEIDFNIYEE